MNYIDLIDSSQAHLFVQDDSNIEIIRQKWRWSCDWQRATPESHVKNKPPLAVPLFRFTLEQNR